MDPQQLPTWNQIADNAFQALDAARSKLSDARDWLNSDWPPDAGPTSAQGEGRHRAKTLIEQAKGLIDEAKTALRAGEE